MDPNKIIAPCNFVWYLRGWFDEVAFDVVVGKQSEESKD